MAGAAAMAGLAYFLERALTDWLFVDLHVPRQAAQLIGVPTAIGAGVALYFGIARVFRFPELGFVMEALRAKKQKKAGTGRS